MRLWWVSMSLFMELAGEQGKGVTSCSTGIPHWEMRLDKSAESVVVPWNLVAGFLGNIVARLFTIVR